MYNIKVKSKELKKYNLPEERVLLEVIDAKPNGLLFGVFLIGLFFIPFKEYAWGLLIVSLSVLMIIFLPGKVLVEFYKDYLVLYNHASKNVCEMIYYEEVVKWRYSYGVRYDELAIVLIDDSVHSVDGFSIVEFERKMNRFLKDKKEKTRKYKK